MRIAVQGPGHRDGPEGSQTDLPEVLPHARKRRNRAKRAAESGLSIVQQIVEQHGGTIEVTSQPGAGSCFTLVLPAASAGSRRAGTTLMLKLLLVEDDPALQFTIQTALEAKGYAVDAVSTTGEAIERLADKPTPS